MPPKIILFDFCSSASIKITRTRKLQNGAICLIVTSILILLGLFILLMFIFFSGPTKDLIDNEMIITDDATVLLDFSTAQKGKVSHTRHKLGKIVLECT